MAAGDYLEEMRLVWEAVKDSLKKDYSDLVWSLWFKELQFHDFEDDMVSLACDSRAKFKIINEKYIQPVEQRFCETLGFDIKVNLVYTGPADTQVKVGLVPENYKETKPGFPANLADYNFEYTFENFIVGGSNKFAHAACVAVATRPATNYNPLFIYGNSGLGKTHLMYATINRLKENNPNIKIIYTKGEDFTNQMIACLTSKTMDEFRDRYRTCDVLLIDDIQFIAGKVATQEEFFHTFNALFEEKKQIILTSDRPPCEIKTLEDRLKSRFEWGLIADIEPPDLELRIAIIKKKAEQVNVVIPDDVLTYLGENLRSNIRQIEGAIKKLGALAFLSGKDITMEVARDCIYELLGGAEPVHVTVEKIFSTVAERYGVKKEELVGTKRNKEIVEPRHLTIFLIREMTEMSFPNIAKLFKRDHTTIMSSWTKVMSRYQLNDHYANEINDLKKAIEG